MELFDYKKNSAEASLVNLAAKKNLPIGGTLELTPLCNMNCTMCYIRLSHKEMTQQGRLLTCDEWLRIANDLKNNGTLFLLITGGEPLLYPEFERLYLSLTKMGFVITINTNGTLITEHFADLFGQYPCRRLNITLYGADDETYASLCNNPNGFSQVMRAVSLLQERNVPFRFNFSATPDNYDKIESIFKVATNCNAHIEPCYYMFPSVRKEQTTSKFNRLSPEQAAYAMINSAQIKDSKSDMRIAALGELLKLKRPPRFKTNNGNLPCRAGISGFWINWKGELLPCGMFNQPHTSLLHTSFKDAWQYTCKKTKEIFICEECLHCRMQNLCLACGASFLTETGSFSKKPEYLCRMTKEKIRLLMNFLNEEDCQILELDNLF